MKKAIAVTIEDELVKKIDEKVNSGEFKTNRSTVVETMIRKYFENESK